MYSVASMFPAFVVWYAVFPKIFCGTFLASFSVFLYSEIYENSVYPVITKGYVASMLGFIAAEMFYLAFDVVVWEVVFAAWLCACLPLAVLRRVDTFVILQIVVFQLMCELCNYRAVAMAALPLVYRFEKQTVCNANFCMVVAWIAWLVTLDAPIMAPVKDGIQFTLLMIALCAQTRVAWYK